MITVKKESSLWMFLEYGLYAFFAVFPFVIYRYFIYGGTTTRAINLITFSLIATFCLGAWLLGRRNYVAIPRSPVVLAIALYGISLVLSAFLGFELSTSFWSVTTRLTGIWYFLNLSLFMYLLWLIISDEVRQRRMVLVVIISAALYSLGSLLGPEGLGLLFRNVTFDGFTFGNSTFAGMYIFAAFMLAVYYLLQSISKKWWHYLLPLVIINNPYILNSQIWTGDMSSGIVGEARASAYVVVLSLVGLALLWIVSKIRKAKIKSNTSYALFFIGVVLMASAAYSLLTPGGYLRGVYMDQATGARPLVWEISGSVISERPLFGWGTDNFERVFESRYDNRLLQDEYGNEAWFDRAHNVFVDQAVDNGIVGLVLYLGVYVVLLLTLIYTALKSPHGNDQLLAAVLIVYFSLHLLELQTAFDTSISYPMIGVMMVLAVAIFERAKGDKGLSSPLLIQGKAKYVIAIGLMAFSSWSMFSGLLPFLGSQIANGQIRTVGSAEKRIPLYPTLFGSQIDRHTMLWRTLIDFQRGIGENPQVLEDRTRVEELKREILIIENGYREYVDMYPRHFRAQLNFANVLIYQMLFGVNKLDEAQLVLDRAIELVPQAPQPYWMKAVSYVYMRKFDLAREYAARGLALNPKIKESEVVMKYVDNSIKSFPEIDLFFFKQT